MSFEALFKPIKIGTMEVRNRLVVPAMETNLVNADGTCTQALVDYHAENSKGGFGLIVKGIAAVSPEGRCCEFQMGLWDDSFIDGYRKLTDEVHKYGAKIAAQLHHAGRETNLTFTRGETPLAPSPLLCPRCQTMPREMTVEEIYQMVEKYADAAERAKKAGFDCVELHAAHGYLVAQFLSMHSNKRTDEFGGTLENRTRFMRLVIQAIRTRLGNDYPIILRISGGEFVTGGRDVTETRAVCKIAESCGVNAIDVSIGTYLTGFLSQGSCEKNPGFASHLAAEVKKAVSIPVIAVGRITDPHMAEELISDGISDMVAIGRQSIADPQFPNKVLAGKLDEIIPCIGCCSCKVSNDFEDNIRRCAVNQFIGRGHDLKIEPVSTPKKVVIAGGGPAGLEAAWILARRGHNVTLYEKQVRLGGAFLAAAYPPGKSDLAKMIRYYLSQGKKYGVKYELGVNVDAALIESVKPDAVILATGSKPLLPNIEGIHNEQFLYPEDILLGRVVPGKRVLVAGGGLIGAELAEFIAEQGAGYRKVTIVEMQTDIALDAIYNQRIPLISRLKGLDVRFVTDAKIIKFNNDGVVFVQDEKEQILKGFDSVALALGTVANNPLEKQLKDKIKEVYVIGDAVKAGKVYPAVRSAVEIAVSV